MASVLAWGWALGSLMCELQGEAGRRISASLRCGSRASVCSFSHRPLSLLASHCLTGPSGFSYLILLFQHVASSFFLLLFSLFLSIIGPLIPFLSLFCQFLSRSLALINLYSASVLPSFSIAASFSSLFVIQAF